MVKLGLLGVLVVLAATVSAAQASWTLYKDDGDTVANYDRSGPYRGQPALWVRWQYKSPRDGVAGIKKQFTADCQAGKFYEIYANPYDANGTYLGADSRYDSP
ncbi:MAG TPA: hypothetical protein VIU41_15045, partial [Geobacteraceae bacterium]